MPQNPALRPEELHVTPLYIDESDASINAGYNEQCSYPSSSYFSNNKRPNLHSTKDSSSESEIIHVKTHSQYPRKAYMDLNDAIALLDETCPNPDASPSITPRKPRTPQIPYSRNKRARSKSSDNSTNLSCEKLNDNTKERDKKRPFLRKIGISKTEDRPFLSKLTPRIIGKPYLEKIGPSRAVEKPFLEKIGPSRTLDKFTFEALKELPRAMIRRTHTTIETSTIARTKTEIAKDSVLVVEEEEPETIVSPSLNNSGIERKRSGKGLLLKMYSFETEDINDTQSTKNNSDAKYNASLDETNENEEEEEITGPSSLPQIDYENDNKLLNSRLNKSREFAMTPELVKCRVTTSEEIVSSNSTGNIESPLEAVSWSNSPKYLNRKPPIISRTLERDFSPRNILINSDDESIPNSPTKRRISKVSPEPQMPIRIIPTKTKNSSLPRDIDSSPTKTRRQASDEKYDYNKKYNEIKYIDDTNRIGSGELLQLTNRRQKFQDTIDKFGGSDLKNSITRRQVSEDILDKSECKKGDKFVNYINDRMGISSDNLQYSHETVVGSAPSASSLGYQSGDSSFTSYRSSTNSQDMLRSTFKLLHSKYELQDVPAESYAAFKRRTRGNYHSLDRQKFINKETTIGPTIKVGKVYDIPSKESLSLDRIDKQDGDDDEPKLIHESRSPEQTDKIIKRSGTIKSVLRKQERVDIPNDQDVDTAGLLKRPIKKLLHDPSEETIELLTELRRVKSLLRTPSEEKNDWELDCLKQARIPKKISLSDKEFCLSVERENSIRRPTSVKVKDNNKIDETDDDNSIKNLSDDDKKFLDDTQLNSGRTRGPALFEKKCLSLDYADDVKPIKPDARAISLASARTTPKSDGDETIGSSGPCVLCDSKSCLSDVFPSPSDTEEKLNSPIEDSVIINNIVPKIIDLNNCLDVDIAIPIDQKRSISPKRRVQIQGRTSDVYEIISPRSTPFRIKKRFDRISVEDSVKQESFTHDKVDCRTITLKKRTKCFPL